MRGDTNVVPIQAIDQMTMISQQSTKSRRAVGGTVERHSRGWRARIWQDERNQRGPSRLREHEAQTDLLAVRSGFPIRRLYESLKPTTVHVEAHGNSYRARFFFGSSNWRTPVRPTQAEALCDLEQLCRHFESTGNSRWGLATARIAL